MSNNARSLNLIGPMFVGSLPGTVIVARRGDRRGASDQLVTGRPEMGSPAPLRPGISVHLPILKFLATVPLVEVSHSTCDRARDRRHALHQAYPVRPGLRQRHSVLVRVLVLPRSHVDDQQRHHLHQGVHAADEQFKIVRRQALADLPGHVARARIICIIASRAPLVWSIIAAGYVNRHRYPTTTIIAKITPESRIHLEIGDGVTIDATDLERLKVPDPASGELWRADLIEISVDGAYLIYSGRFSRRADGSRYRELWTQVLKATEER